MGRGFIKVGRWSMEEPGVPLSHFFFFFFFQEPCGEYRTPSAGGSSQILDAIARLSQEAGHAHGSLNLLFMFIHRYYGSV